MPSTERRQRRHEPPKPEFFVDRDLGRYKVPQALRDLGFTVHPLFEVYGKDAEETTRDPQWIVDASKKGWVILCRDKLRHRGERAAIAQHKARVFRVARSAKNAQQQIESLTNNINAIVRRSAQEGPYIYRVDKAGLDKIWPRKS